LTIVLSKFRLLQKPKEVTTFKIWASEKNLKIAVKNQLLPLKKAKLVHPTSRTITENSEALQGKG
jgi:hypothetical protein